MLNMLSDLEAAAAQVRTPSGSGACLPSGVAATTQMREGTVEYARPRIFWAADVSGQRRLAAGLAVLVLGQPNQKQYPHTTRIAASGGTKGPHPWREPEPA